MHLLVQVCHLHAGLDKVAQLLRQVRQQVLQAEGGAWLAVAAHCHYFSQLVIQRGVDGSDGVLPAEERLTPYRRKRKTVQNPATATPGVGNGYGFESQIREFLVIFVFKIILCYYSLILMIILHVSMRVINNSLQKVSLKENNRKIAVTV